MRWLQKKIADLEKTNRDRPDQLFHQETASNMQGLLEKRYDDMRKYYEGRLRDQERELIEYKEIVNRIR